MTQKEVREQLELCERGSGAPWVASGMSVKCDRGTVAAMPTPQNGGVFDCAQNTDLVANCRNHYPELLKQHDKAMRFLKEGHDHFHGHLGDHDNCLVRDAVRAYFGETL